MLSSLLIAAAALLLAADGPPGGADHPGALVRARRATLAEMTVGAGRIFVGTVIKARDLEVPQDLPITPVDGLPRMKVREITFVVHRRLKGMESDDPVVTIRQAREFAARLETGDQVLWFLPGEGRLGLVAPIGITSGDFRITTNRTTGVKYATNLSHNVRLFDSQAFARPIPLDDLVAAVEGVLRETVAP